MNPMLIEGLSDAVGFVGGALLAFWLARLAGFDLMEPGYSNSSIAAIVAVGLGGGLGLQLARRWRQARQKSGE